MKYITLSGLAMVVWLVTGCGGDSSSATGPNIGDIAKTGGSVGPQHPTNSCVIDGHGHKVSDGPGVTFNPPSNPPGNPSSDPGDPSNPPGGGKNKKKCDDPHFGGGNGGVDCGKDDPNGQNGINDGPTKGKK